MMLVREALSGAVEKLGNALEARMLLSHVTELSQGYLVGHGSDELTISDAEKFNILVKRRSESEPMAYITGYKEFYGRDFAVNDNVLIPRSDSEVLIDVVLSRWADNWDNLSILDLGVGSGCLLITLLMQMEGLRGVGIDISENELNVARSNMLAHEVGDRCRLAESNWFENVQGKYDIIISNPPYISVDEKHLMAQETLLYEPITALFGPKNGLWPYEAIAARAREFLTANGRIYVEIGANREAEVSKIFTDAMYEICSKHNDLQGHVRVLELRPV